jgi:hypothetical protein
MENNKSSISADFLLKIVYLDKGTHFTEFEYEPPCFILDL